MSNEQRTMGASAPSDDLRNALGDPTLSTEAEPRNWKLWFRLGFAALIAAAFLTFVLQNTESVDVSFLGWSISLAQSILMVLCGVAGVVLWEIAGFLSRRCETRTS